MTNFISIAIPSLILTIIMLFTKKVEIIGMNFYVGYVLAVFSAFFIYTGIVYSIVFIYKTILEFKISIDELKLYIGSLAVLMLISFHKNQPISDKPFFPFFMCVGILFVNYHLNHYFKKKFNHQ
ncbi:hypothetical protein M0R36_10825 [bacterium]|jgi:uncharacterized membrane protein|nr:hypothetical protein [bacterium]